MPNNGEKRENGNDVKWEHRNAKKILWTSHILVLGKCFKMQCLVQGYLTCRVFPSQLTLLLSLSSELTSRSAVVALRVNYCITS